MLERPICWCCFIKNSLFTLTITRNAYTYFVKKTRNFLMLNQPLCLANAKIYGIKKS